jgi:L-ribulose-5-phosphate 3-epimerase
MPGPFLSINPASYGPYRSGAFAHIASLGVKHVEVGVPAPDRVGALRDELAGHGLTASSLMLPLDLSDQNCFEAIVPHLDVCQAMGVRYAFVSVKAGDTERTTAYDRLRECGIKAEDRDVLLCVETHPDLAHNGDVALETMRSVGHRAVRVNYDTANVLYYSDGPLRDTLEELAKVDLYVASVHLKEYASDQPRAWAFPALGEGIIDFPGVFRLLSERQFHGPYTLELEGCEGEKLTEEQMHERVATSVRLVRENGITD